MSKKSRGSQIVGQYAKESSRAKAALPKPSQLPPLAAEDIRESSSTVNRTHKREQPPLSLDDIFTSGSYEEVEGMRGNKRFSESSIPLPPFPPGVVKSKENASSTNSAWSSTNFPAPPKPKSKPLQKTYARQQTALSFYGPTQQTMFRFGTPARKDAVATGFKSSESSVVKEGVGLKNLGNTCYINAGVQALLALEDFVKEVCVDDTVAMLRSLTPEGQPSFYDGFFQFVGVACKSAGTVVSAEMLKKLIAFTNERFSGNAQQDAHEFIQTALNVLDEEVEEKLGLKVGPSLKFFGLEVGHNLVCSACKFQKKVEETYRDLSVELSIKTESAPLMQLMWRFFSPESGIEWNCTAEGCGGKIGSLTHQILKPPRILMIHLKRFFMNESGILEKNQMKVQIPEKLDLSEFAAVRCVFRLRAIVLHLGTSIQRGHYICHALKRGKFFAYNDSQVKEISDVEAFKGEDVQRRAYILFYEKIEQSVAI